MILASFTAQAQDPSALEIKVMSHNINGGHQDKIPCTTKQAMRMQIDIIALQETKMKQEEENQFKYNEIHKAYTVMVDNLNEEERIQKRDNNISSGEILRKPQSRIKGSEGLLLAIRKSGNSPKWPTTFHKNPNHRVLSECICPQC